MILNGSQALDLLVGLRETATGASSIGTLFGARVDFIGSNITLGRDVSWGAVSPALSAYPGYADQVVTWNLPSVADAGGVEVVSNQLIARPTSGDNTSTVYGMLVRSAGVDTVVLMAGNFDSPIPMSSALDMLQLNIRYKPGTSAVGQVLS